jgi:hypothetical protein
MRQVESTLTALPSAHAAQGVKNGFPLKIEPTTVEEKEAEFNPGTRTDRPPVDASNLPSRQ